MNRIEILIIDDDKELAYTMKAAIEKEPAFELVGIAHNGEDGINLIIAKRPQVVLLDIVMPIKDGNSVLYYLNTHQLSDGYQPKVIVLSSMANRYLVEKCSSLGALYYMIKPFELDYLIRTIKDISNWKPEKDEQEEGQKQIPLDRWVSLVLDELGLPPNLKGYRYAKDIILEQSNSADKAHVLAKELYANLSKKYNDNHFCIERALRTIIQKGWSKDQFNGSPLFMKFQKCPSNKQFLSLITKHVQEISNA